MSVAMAHSANFRKINDPMQFFFFIYHKGEELHSLRIKEYL